MVTRKLFTLAKGLGVGMVVGLLAQQATATEEMVVYGTAAAAEARVEPAMFRAEIENSINSFNEQLRAMLERDLKLALAPKVELASAAEARPRG